MTTFRVAIDGSECDLTPGQLAERAKALYAVAVRDSDAALQSTVKLGALLLQVRPSFRHGSWVQWQKATGLARNTAARAIRLAAAYAGVQGQLDERRLVEAIAQYNDACTDVSERLNPASRSVRTAEKAMGTPPATPQTEESYVPRAVHMDPFDDDADFDPDDSPEAIAAALADETSGGDAGDGSGGGWTGAEETEGLTNTGGGHVVHAPRPSPHLPQETDPCRADTRGDAGAGPETRSGHGSSFVARARVPDAAGQAMLSDLFAELDARVEQVRDLAGRGELSAEAIREVLAVLERVADRGAMVGEVAHA